MCVVCFGEISAPLGSVAQSPLEVMMEVEVESRER